MTPEPLIISGAMTNNLIAAYGAGKRRTPAAVKERKNMEKKLLVLGMAAMMARRRGQR
ncbi:MAG: hypothetical protein ACLUNV_08995 [Sutterella wadsworthensis]